ncbi:hypothetical protein D6817_02545 [Candidatus Pacearchaeota archaeon]|nr:MAG: hypothetical protein D6817_02545 [Candidatus Pacearchaeota archaeon]
MEAEIALKGENEERQNTRKNLSDLLENVKRWAWLARRSFVGTVAGALGTLAAMTYNYDVAKPLYRELDALQQQQVVVAQDYRALQRIADEAGLENEAIARAQERLGEKLEAIEARASDVKSTIVEVDSPPLPPTSVLTGVTAMNAAALIYSLRRIDRETERYKAQLKE